jgi:hypothetical protein
VKPARQSIEPMRRWHALPDTPLRADRQDLFDGAITAGFCKTGARTYREAAFWVFCLPYKVRMHQEFLRNWLNARYLPGSWTYDEIWRVREECIAALEK